MNLAISADGTLDVAKLWQPTAKNGIIRASRATNRLRVGGTGSSKSSDALMEAITNYLFRWDGCAALFLRRNLGDLEKSSILDLHAFIPKELFDYHGTNHVATFFNGSKLFFGHLQNNSEKDLQQYLSAAFPVIVLDECGQLSGNAWSFLQSRNRVNRECRADDLGHFPKPVMLGCTNPIGPHWGFYKSVFVDKKPWDVPDGAKRDRNGRWWVKQSGDWELVYNPDDWDYVHSTLLDNPYLLERDPDLHRKLMALPAAMRSKLLYGYMDKTVGQYFDCWDDSLHVIDLAKDPQAIIWQPWQPRWMGWDWGRAHWTAMYWFTIAQVKSISGQYATKTVCYREHVDRGKSYEELVRIAHTLNRLGLPANPEATSLRAIYFSHEKFAKKFDETQAPSMVVSRLLMEKGMPGVSPAKAGSGSRVAKASLLYDQLKMDKLVVLENCRDIIESIPTLVRDEEEIEDVLKVDGKADDCYDGFTMGLYSWYGQSKKPQEVKDAERLKSIDDPYQRRLEQIKLTYAAQARRTQEPERRPEWM